MVAVVEPVVEERTARPVDEDGMGEARLDIAMVKTERMALPAESKLLTLTPTLSSKILLIDL